MISSSLRIALIEQEDIGIRQTEWEPSCHLTLFDRGQDSPYPKCGSPILENAHILSIKSAIFTFFLRPRGLKLTYVQDTKASAISFLF